MQVADFCHWAWRVVLWSNPPVSFNVLLELIMFQSAEGWSMDWALHSMVYIRNGLPSWKLYQYPKSRSISRQQEGARKDVECAFGVLQSHFTIVHRPARLWKRRSVGRVMLARVILHNSLCDSPQYDSGRWERRGDHPCWLKWDSRAIMWSTSRSECWWQFVLRWCAV